MKSNSPKILAAALALLIVILTGSIVSINIFANKTGNPFFYLVSVLALYLVSFVFLYYILHTFLNKRIIPLYKIINDVSNQEKNKIMNYDDDEFFNQISLEVLNWARKKSEEIKLLKDREKFTKEFIGNVAHELKTPIFNIQGYILTLIDGGLEDPTINKKYLKRAENNIDRLVSTIRDVDTISQLEGGVLKLIYEKFNITDLVEEIFEILEMKAEKNKISLKLIDSEKKMMVYADKKRISEVLNNLIVNSIKYGIQGGTTKVSIYEKESYVFVKVVDDGIGIGESHIPHIFGRFYRVDKSRSREQGGSGLGLSIVKHIIEAHNQTIDVESVLEKGTTFTFTLAKG